MPPIQPTSSPDPPVTRLRILLVEDDALIGPLLAEMLADLGYEIDAIATTEDGAVAAAARHKPDLMIVDMRLARGSGVAAVERINRAGPIPHVFMSGLGRLAAAPGAVMLAKPFREADLVRAIARALGLVHDQPDGLRAGVLPVTDGNAAL